MIAHRPGIARGGRVALQGGGRVQAPDPPDLKGLRPEQKEGVLWLRARKAGLLADDMGIGKTVQALRALPRRARAIVVCPASVTLTWEDEIAKWRPDLKATVGEALRRPEEGEVLIISYHALPDAPRASRFLIQDPLHDVDLILDECHMVKDESAQRTEKVRRLATQCARVWGLTGTPMLGSPEDLWGVLASVRLAAELYGDRRIFIQMCGGKERWLFDKRRGCAVRRGWVWGQVSPEVKQVLTERGMLRRLRRDVLDLPPLQQITIPVAAPEDLTEYLDEIKAAWDEVGADDLPPFELLSEARAALARSRIPAAVEWAGNNATDETPLLVFSAHQEPIVAVGALPGAVSFTGVETKTQREAAIRRFKAGKARILATTIACGGAGLNLQEAGAVLMIDRDWTPGMNHQAVARMYRGGQTRASVLVASMISRHPLDVRLNEILVEKERLIAAAVGS
jgi:SNF2 family DNA or RNA helicase